MVELDSLVMGSPWSSTKVVEGVLRLSPMPKAGVPAPPSRFVASTAVRLGRVTMGADR